VSLWGKDQIMCEFRVAVEGPDAKKNIAVMKVESFIPDDKFFTFKWRAPGQVVVNDVIELICRMI
jgi:hypothetical protein